MSEIVSSIQLGVRPKELRPRQQKVLDLINSCIKEKKILDDDVLQDWFMEKIVKPRNRTVTGRYLGQNENGYNVYEKLPEYETRLKEIKERGHLRYWNFAEAKTILKYSIGSLVLRGYLVVLPVIKINDSEEQKQIENE